MNLAKKSFVVFLFGSFLTGFIPVPLSAQSGGATKPVKQGPVAAGGTSDKRAPGLAGAAAGGPHWFLLVGGYTKASADKGIAVYDFNVRTGDFRFRSVKGGIENPSYLAVSRDNKKVYAVSELDEGMGKVSAYRFDPLSGQLALINTVGSGGEGPCYVSVNDAEDHVFAANYSNGKLGAIAVNGDGSLDGEVQSIAHSGSSINPESQRGPHVHSTVLSPDGHYLLSADLGVDKVYIYRVNAADRKTPLSPAEPAFVSVQPGSGPRHICFSPNGRSVYVINEMGGSIDVYDYKAGVLSARQHISLLAPGFKGVIEAADIHISPDGKFLYGSNRETSNELIIFGIGKNGVLKLAGRQSVLGKTPRNFVIDPTGKFLLVANQQTNQVLLFRRNTTTGLLHFTGKKIDIGAPACLKFIAGER